MALACGRMSLRPWSARESLSTMNPESFETVASFTSHMPREKFSVW